MAKEKKTNKKADLATNKDVVVENTTEEEKDAQVPTVGAETEIEAPESKSHRTSLTRGVLYTMITSKNKSVNSYLASLTDNTPAELIDYVNTNEKENDYMETVYNTADEKTKKHRDDVMKLFAYIILDDQENVDKICNGE